MLAAAAAAVATGAAAQAEPDVTHDGRWVASIRPADGSRQTARLVLREFGGEWTGAGGARAVTGDACAGRKLPITVQATTAGALAFTVWGAQISRRCANLTVETRAVGNDVFEGEIESVGTIRLTRK